MTAPADLPTALAVLRRERDRIREQYRVEVFGVVGSLARGEARPDSDVDVLTEWLDGTTLFRVGAAMCLLEDELGRPIQLIDREMLKPDMRESMARDFVPA